MAAGECDLLDMIRYLVCLFPHFHCWTGPFVWYILKTTLLAPNRNKVQCKSIFSLGLIGYPRMYMRLFWLWDVKWSCSRSSPFVTPAIEGTSTSSTKADYRSLRDTWLFVPTSDGLKVENLCLEYLGSTLDYSNKLLKSWDKLLTLTHSPGLISFLEYFWMMYVSWPKKNRLFLCGTLPFSRVSYVPTAEFPLKRPHVTFQDKHLHLLGMLAPSSTLALVARWITGGHSDAPKWTQEPFYTDFHACLCFTCTEVDGICWDMLGYAECHVTALAALKIVPIHWILASMIELGRIWVGFGTANPTKMNDTVL